MAKKFRDLGLWSGQFSAFGETLSTVGVWRYPKQMIWPSAVATTTLRSEGDE
jgi:hypothetical protein